MHKNNSSWQREIVLFIGIFFLLFLTIVSILFSSDGYEVSFHLGMSMPIIAGGIAASTILLLSGMLDRFPKICRLAFLACLFVFSMSFSAWWIENSAYLPQSDAKSIYDIVVRAKNHDLLPIAPTGSYMSLCPYQAGLVLFMESILRFVPNANEVTIQRIYLLFIALLWISILMSVKKLFSSSRICVISCVLFTFCFPVLLYVNNMYGDVPCIALTFFAFWMLTEYLAGNKRWGVFFAWIALAGAVAIRKNSLIFVLACIIVLVISLFGTWERKIMILLAVIITSTVAGAVIPGSIYEHRAKNTMGEGIPAIAYIAMGLQWSEGRDPGGWNGYHSDLYMNCDYDEEMTAQISKESVKESLGYMMEHPEYMAKFFFYKLVTQWTREDFGCIYATLGSHGNRTDKAWEIYQGAIKDDYMFVMSIHQSLVYAGALCFCFGAFIWKRKWTGNGLELWNLVPLITFIGGFLFSLMWEAGARYVLPYFVLLIPYAAAGLVKIGCVVETFGKNAFCHWTKGIKKEGGEAV